MVNGVVRLTDFANSWSLRGYEAYFEAAGSSGIDTSYSYPGLPMVELLLPVVEMVF
jgi:hypothetical protein